MKIINLEINNILSIEHANIAFGDKGLILVEGFDYDTGRANGAGKSSIFNALSFALFDKVPRGITKSEILRKGQKRGYASASISTDGGKYTVTRSRPSQVTFFKDDNEIHMTQEEFESKIGMNYDQFLVTMYTAQDSNNKFIYLNDSGKKNFILKIMNLDGFNKYKQQVTDKYKKLQLEESNLLGKMEVYKSHIEVYKTSITNEDDLTSRIEQNNKDIEAYNKEIINLQKIQKPDLSKYDEIENKIQTKISEIKAAKVLRAADLKEFHKYESMIVPFDPKNPDASCPVCSADLNIQGKTLAKADDVRALKAQHESHMQELQDIKREYKSKIDNHDIVINQENDLLNTSAKLRAKRAEESKEYADAQMSINEYSNSIRIKRSDNENLKSQIETNNNIKIKAAQAVKQATECKGKIQEINSELGLLKAVESIFDTTGAPAYIMDSIVDSFNEYVSDYISEIWPNASYTLQTYKENKDKTIKAKFSETLTINGKDRSIGSLSGGEIRALSLALDFAIIDVLGNKYSLSLNPIILDEPFNGLDSVGRELVINILKKFSDTRQVWVVDHASEAKSMFDDTVTVVKRNGVSKIT